jgi:hypothetical protein
MDDALRGLLLQYDSSLPKQRADAKADIIEFLIAAWYGHPESSQYMRMFAAALMERGDPLPDVVLGFIVEFLRNPDKPKWPTYMLEAARDARGESFIDEVRSRLARKPGKHSSNFVTRNIFIWAAIEHIVKTWKFAATRNEATKGRASAASIVREAIKQGAGIHLSEASVVKVWNKMRLPGEQALVLLEEMAAD